jgi:hypothetical protein
MKQKAEKNAPKEEEQVDDKMEDIPIPDEKPPSDLKKWNDAVKEDEKLKDLSILPAPGSTISSWTTEKLQPFIDAGILPAGEKAAAAVVKYDIYWSKIRPAPDSESVVRELIKNGLNPGTDIPQGTTGEPEVLPGGAITDPKQQKEKLPNSTQDERDAIGEIGNGDGDDVAETGMDERAVNQTAPASGTGLLASFMTGYRSMYSYTALSGIEPSGEPTQRLATSGATAPVNMALAKTGDLILHSSIAPIGTAPTLSSPFVWKTPNDALEGRGRRLVSVGTVRAEDWLGHRLWSILAIVNSQNYTVQNPKTFSLDFHTGKYVSSGDAIPWLWLDPPVVNLPYWLYINNLTQSVNGAGSLSDANVGMTNKIVDPSNPAMKITEQLVVPFLEFERNIYDQWANVHATQLITPDVLNRHLLPYLLYSWSIEDARFVDNFAWAPKALPTDYNMARAAIATWRDFRNSLWAPQIIPLIEDNWFLGERDSQDLNQIMNGNIGANRNITSTVKTWLSKVTALPANEEMKNLIKWLGLSQGITVTVRFEFSEPGVTAILKLLGALLLKVMFVPFHLQSTTFAYEIINWGARYLTWGTDDPVTTLSALNGGNWTTVNRRPTSLNNLRPFDFSSRPTWLDDNWYAALATTVTGRRFRRFVLLCLSHPGDPNQRVTDQFADFRPQMSTDDFAFHPPYSATKPWKDTLVETVESQLATQVIDLLLEITFNVQGVFKTNIEGYLRSTKIALSGDRMHNNMFLMNETIKQVAVSPFWFQNANLMPDNPDGQVQDDGTGINPRLASRVAFAVDRAMNVVPQDTFWEDQKEIVPEMGVAMLERLASDITMDRQNRVNDVRLSADRTMRDIGKVFSEWFFMRTMIDTRLGFAPQNNWLVKTRRYDFVNGAPDWRSFMTTLAEGTSLNPTIFADALRDRNRVLMPSTFISMAVYDVNNNVEIFAPTPVLNNSWVAGVQFAIAEYEGHPASYGVTYGFIINRKGRVEFGRRLNIGEPTVGDAGGAVRMNPLLDNLVGVAPVFNDAIAIRSGQLNVSLAPLEDGQYWSVDLETFIGYTMLQRKAIFYGDGLFVVRGEVPLVTLVADVQDTIIYRADDTIYSAQGRIPIIKRYIAGNDVSFNPSLNNSILEIEPLTFVHRVYANNIVVDPPGTNYDSFLSSAFAAQGSNAPANSDGMVADMYSVARSYGGTVSFDYVPLLKQSVVS